MSLDYYDIRVNNAITAATPGDIISACFGSVTAASAASAACNTIRRNPTTGGLSGPTGTVKGLPSPTTNLGRLKTDGLDLKLGYKREFGDVGLTLDFNGNWTRSLQFKASPSAASINRECVGFYSANCGVTLGQIQPEFSFQQRSTVAVGPASLSLLWRYLSSVKYEPGLPPLFRGTITNQAPAVSALAGEVVDFNRIRAYHYFDLSAQFDVMKTMTLTVGMTNLFNVRPPIVGAAAGSTSANSGNTFPSTYDPLGRSFNASVRMKF